MTTTLITGANRGIGLELARTAAARGHDVIAVVRKSSPELDALGVRVETEIDVTSPEAVADLASRLGDARLDIVINNAGVLLGDGLENLDVASIRRQLEVNAIAPVALSRTLLPRLGDGSKLVVITSRMGSIGDNTSGGSYGYRMSKAALNAAAVSLAHDLAPRGIAVGILHPGWVQTDMTRGSGNVTPAEAAAQLWKRIDELDRSRAGRFFHANGEELPW